MSKRLVSFVVALALLCVLLPAQDFTMATEGGNIPTGSPETTTSIGPETPAVYDPTPPVSNTPSESPLVTTPPPSDTPTQPDTPTLPGTPSGTPPSESPLINTPPPSQSPSQSPVATPTDASPTPLATPTDGPGVTITATDTVVNLNDQQFSLLDPVTAVDENNNPVEIIIADVGGFRIDLVGTYTIWYEATHPVTLEKVIASCIITVVDTGEPQEEEKSTLTGTSDSRYRKYAQYRDEVSAELNAHMTRLNQQFTERMELLRGAFDHAGGYQLLRRYYADIDTDELPDTDFALEASYEELSAPTLYNWSQVLAVYVAKNTSLTVENPLDLFNLRKISFDEIDDVFWDMHDLRFEESEGTTRMILMERTSEEMADRYGFSAERRAQLDELTQPEFLRLFAALTGDPYFSDLSDAETEAIRATLPDGLNMQQEQVVLTAHTLVGQVKYFWGGKYATVGWNPLWGVPKVVTSQNSPTTGTVRPFGLDCSGFVTWVFVNAAADPGIVNAIGNGSANQWRNSKALGWDEARPGDLAFKAAPGATRTNHVGIVVEVQEDGTILVAHCSSSKNNVVITEAWSSSFRYIRRPVIYG